MSSADQRAAARRGRPREQLYLLFRLGQDRYAIAAQEVVEVLPMARFKQIPEAPPWVAGVFSRRGMVVPVLDLVRRASGQPAAALTSTRLVLVNLYLANEPSPRCLGLILEQATDTLRCAPEHFREHGLEAGTAPYLGPVLETATGLVQRIEVARLLPTDVSRVLFAEAQERSADD